MNLTNKEDNFALTGTLNRLMDTNKISAICCSRKMFLLLLVVLIWFADGQGLASASRNLGKIQAARNVSQGSDIKAQTIAAGTKLPAWLTTIEMGSTSKLPETTKSNKMEPTTSKPSSATNYYSPTVTTASSGVPGKASGGRGTCPTIRV